MATLFLIFNHRLTHLQESDARSNLGVAAIVDLPDNLKAIWADVPPALDSLADYLAPVKHWLAATAVPGDYMLVQGDFGATFLMVTFAFAQGLVPLYSTTNRQAEEQHDPDGTVRLVHRFYHQRYRRYGR